jgi:Asp-tRNA(Asn)/Glu-tRNA(Gln) amidotransferase A subunit family amidase
MSASGQPTGTEAVAAVATGVSSVSDIVAGCLDRVGEIESSVAAFKVIDETAVRSAAKERDDRPGGPLHGLVVGVKDVIDTADLPTGYGSPLFEGHRPAADADVVAALRRAGALVLGKTESTEFAMFHPARTRNPAAPGRTPGGSSSGSAAAVAAGMVPVALGTQTAGSVIRPAAYCGVWGFKPSRGWTSTAGIWRLSGQLDTVGLFARCAADLALLYRGIAGAGPGTGTGRLPSVAVLTGEEWAECSGDVRDALEQVAGRLADRGFAVRPMRMPASWRHLPQQHVMVMAAEVARNLHAALGDRIGQVSAAAQAIVQQGDDCTAGEYLAALAARDEALTQLAPLATAADLILTPSAPGVAPEGLQATGDPVLCRPWTLLGRPAANVPGCRSADGLPVGVQLVGVSGGDLSFLASLATVEAALRAPTPPAQSRHEEDRK